VVKYARHCSICRLGAVFASGEHARARQNRTGSRYAKREARISVKVVKPHDDEQGRGNAQQSCSGCYVDAEKYDALYGRSRVR